MSKEHLATYLNDHLAGSVTAIEMLEKLEETYRENEFGRVAAELKVEVEADQKQLEQLMQRLDISQSSTRKATAWIAEKFAAMKLRWDDESDGPLRLYESYEGLSLGIEGKRSLWLALQTASKADSSLQVADYATLITRAEQQRAKAEAMRLKAAAAALLMNQ
jgi:hypothetical protein